MINTTNMQLVFIEDGEALNTSIVAALRLASKWLLQAYGREKIDLSKVNSKSYKEVIFPAYVEEFILRSNKVVFTGEYVRDAFEFVRVQACDCSPLQYSRLTMSEGTHGKREYRRSYLPPLRRGFGAFLVALHIRGAIVLPFNFRWPISLELDACGKILGRREICPLAELPELLRLLRSLDSQSEIQKTEVSFNDYSLRMRETLFTLGHRLIVASGWLTLNDANYDDLLALWDMNQKNRFSRNENLCCHLLADLLQRKYGSLSPIDGTGWRKAVSRFTTLRQRSSNGLAADDFSDDTTLLEQALALNPSQMTTEQLAEMKVLPGLEFDLQERAKTWIAIERTWLKKVKRESNVGRLAAIGLLNTYLFAYLPYWLTAHPTFQYPFPETPNGLIGAVFVSDLGVLDHQDKPRTLVDFLEAMAANRKWGNPTHYAHLKQIEKLFEFAERIGDQIPGCAGFKQPLSPHDYPLMAHSYGTNKRPIPRRIFKFYLSYIEALIAHAEALLSRVISGSVPNSEIGSLMRTTTTTIDCFERQDLFGFIPVVFYHGKVIPLRRIPNILCIAQKRINDGRVLQIPHPHAMHQILAALYSGIRNNHLQWLDAMTFDMYVDTEDVQRDFAVLYVNTDKVKTMPWRSHVNFRVIEILRAQLAWRKLVAEPGFSNKVFYNENPDSKWGQFHCLFAYDADGKPHGDSVYTSAWNRILAGVQGMLSEIGERKAKLVRLLPSSVPYAVPDQLKRLHEYGSQQDRYCSLILKTDITPHSARVSVVSHGISILPADLIGRYWTGQSEATVYYYVVPDEDETYAEQQRQAQLLRKRGYEQGYEAMLAASPEGRSPFIKADGVNSRLAQSLQLNVEETITAYGCVSLSLSGDVKTGLDVLRETRAVGAIANKTELCPYGNQCPTDVVVKMKGFRRCGPCHFAVRSIDHLPAITTKIRQVLEGLTELEKRLDADEGEIFTPEEWNALATNRDILAEDLAAWQMAAEVLEVMRQRLAAGKSTKAWHVQCPDIIEQDLKRVLFPTETTEYLLARLRESEAFPALESPQIRAKFDLLRRNLLANTGNLREAFRLDQPANPAAECLGLIRSIAEANHLGIEEIRQMMETGNHDAKRVRTLRVLPDETS